MFKSDETYHFLFQSGPKFFLQDFSMRSRFKIIVYNRVTKLRNNHRDRI